MSSVFDLDFTPEGASNFGTKCSESTCKQVVPLAMLAEWDTQF